MNKRKIYLGLKKYLIDVSAALIFFTPLLAMLEYFIVGLSLSSVLKTRIIAAITYILFARIYGKFREFWARLNKADYKSSKLKKFFVDISCTLIFLIPGYSTILYISGASLKQILIALPSNLIIGIVFARPYGYFLDSWRKLFNIKTVLKK